ncbi:hypothetical protein Pan216_18030 [Planctomycetes bacterium Pan216]|uniref:Uncharacterized protein n=1 Tax=Kolteria novifilia TaxID=2527975 RepID=A0A518B1U5_9BACT|nr:hypothetical protein Pan216_18030 [Planctomycetes bacterium Pan216]
MPEIRGLGVRLVSALTLAVGVAIVWGFVVSWPLQMVTTALRGSGGARQLQVTGRGEPLVATWNGNNSWGGYTYEDLEGNSVDVPADQAWLSSGPLRLGVPPSHLPTWMTPVSWRNRIRGFNTTSRHPQYWYFICGDEPHPKAYFVGYERLSSQRIGFLGAYGERGEPIPAGQRFSIKGDLSHLNQLVVSPQQIQNATQPYYGSVVAGPDSIPNASVFFVTTDDSLMVVDLDRKTIKRVLEETPIRSMVMLNRSTSSAVEPMSRLLVRTNDTILEFDRDLTNPRRWGIPRELRDRPLTWIPISAEESFVTQQLPIDNSTGVEINMLYWVDPTGRIKRDRTLALRRMGPDPLTGQAWVGASLVVPCPLLIDLSILVLMPLLSYGGTEVVTYQQGLAKSLAELWPAILVVHGLGLLLAWWTLRRTARYGFGQSERSIWTVLVALGGLPFWVSFLICRHWPVLERCPQCGEETPRDRKGCVHCESELAPPKLVGTEVFA